MNEICLLCDKSASNGVLFEGSPGYGSRFDSTLLCEQSLRIAICDECLTQCGRKISLVYRPRPVRPDPIVKEWDPTYDCNEPAASRLAEALRKDPTHPDYEAELRGKR